MNDVIAKFGHKVNLKDKNSISASLNQLLQNVQGKKEQNLVDTLTIRSMSKAIYTTENIGHYGLSFEYYSHFTSPIRRYPDVMVHRLLQHYLDGGKSAKEEIYEAKCKTFLKYGILGRKCRKGFYKIHADKIYARP